MAGMKGPRDGRMRGSAATVAERLYPSLKSTAMATKTSAKGMRHAAHAAAKWVHAMLKLVGMVQSWTPITSKYCTVLPVDSCRLKTGIFFFGTPYTH